MNDPVILDRGELRRLAEWRHYVIGPDCEVTPANKYHPTIHCGIYVLFGKDDGLLYVGKSYGIGYRVVQHFWASQRGQRAPFASYACMEVPAWLMGDIETAHIHALDPPENKHLPRPDWTYHDDAVTLIRELWGEKI